MASITSTTSEAFSKAIGCDGRWFQCCTCGEELFFTNLPTDEEVIAELEAHRCFGLVRVEKRNIN